MSRVLNMKQQAKRNRIFSFAILVSAFLVNTLAIAETNVGESWIGDADVKAVKRVIDSQIFALKSGDHQSAYSYAAPNVKQAFPSAKNFISMVQSGYKPLYEHTSYIFGKNTVSNGEVYQEVIVADETRQLWQFIYTLSQQSDYRWKVTNVVMYPYKGTSV